MDGTTFPAALALTLITAGAYLCARLLNGRLGFAPTTAAHYGLLIALAGLGGNCLVLSLSVGGVGYPGLNLLLLSECAILLLMDRRIAVCGRAAARPRSGGLTGSFGLIYLVTVATSIVIAVRFFTPDLVPSSMTGDPARHFLGALDISSEPTPLQKPIYYAILGLVFPLTGLNNDIALVSINIALFSLLNGSYTLLIHSRKDEPATGVRLALVSALVTGYSLFAMIYGYFALILASAFAASALAVMRDYSKTPTRTLYWLAVTMLCGAALSHAFLMPVLLVTFSTVVGKAHRYQITAWARDAWPGLAVVIIVSLITTWYLVGSIDPPLLKTVKAGGFVDEDLTSNLLFPSIGVLVLALVHRRDSEFRSLLIIVGAVAATFGGFVTLREFHFVAPYYANRLQILFLPLLIATCAEGFMRLSSRRTWPLQLFAGIGAIVQMGACIGTDQEPLANTATNFALDLRWMDTSIYAQNRVLIAHSPLQFTANDRTRLRAMARGDDACIPASVHRVPVIGTDHSAIWFEIYTGKIASYRDRNDGYIRGDDYMNDAEDWLSGRGESYIVVISHMNHMVLPRLVRKIREWGTLVCRGDAYEIYRRPASVDGIYLSY